MLSEIFKAYDVRGVYGKNITEKIVYNIGRAFVYFLKFKNLDFKEIKEIVVGTDMRLSSPKLSKAFMNGITEQGYDVIFIGKVCTDAVYFASGFLHKPAVMFTASHNPKQYNGIKFCKADAIPINEDTGLKEIKSIIENKAYDKAYDKSKINIKGKVIRKNILAKYVEHVRNFINTKNLIKLKIAVDAGNGMAGKIVPLVYKGLPIKIFGLYFKLDGNFPNHNPDPSKYENLVDLQKIVKEKNCDFGIEFDGDADRVFFIDENGSVVNSSLISALIIKNLLTSKKSYKQLSKTKEGVIYNVVCSHIVPETIEEYGGTPIIERVGHSFIKDTMRKTNAIFACEHSAHYYYKDNYRADSAIITSLIVSEIISKACMPLSKILEEFRKYHTLEENSIEVSDKSVKLKEIELIYKKQNPKKISKLDGITVEFKDWWFNLRPSNTEPLLRLNLEASDEQLMKEKKDEVIKFIKKE